MAFGFQGFGHFVASVSHDIVTLAKKVMPVAQKLAASEQTVEAVTALIDPQAVVIERAAYAILGKVMEAAHSTEKALSGGTVSLQFTTEEVKELEDLYKTFFTLAATHSLTAAAAVTNGK
jgi:hypothetical protein